MMLQIGGGAFNTSGHDLRFPISFGRHRNVPCTDCHVAEAAPRIVLCTGCHAHDAQLLQQQHRNLGSMQSGCLHCHPGGAAR